MRKVLLGLLVVIVALGLFATAGYAGYRFGYVQGVRATAKNTAPLQPQLRPFDDFGRRGLPMRRFGFERGVARGGFPMIGFGLFAVLGTLARLVVLALIVWFIYWLFTRSGWRLTRQPIETRPPAETPQPAQESSSKTENE
jgi:uncharacterized membrane protein